MSTLRSNLMMSVLIGVIEDVTGAYFQLPYPLYRIRKAAIPSPSRVSFSAKVGIVRQAVH